MQDPMETVRALAERIGSRPATSATEAEAAAYVNSRMRQIGLDVDMQLFRSLSSPGLPHILIYLAFLLTPLVYTYSAPGAVALVSLALAAFLAEILCLPPPSSWLPGGRSQNVVGTRPAAQESRQHLIVVAHLDTARASLLFHPRLVGGMRRIFFLLLLAMTLLLLLTALGWWLGNRWLGYAQWLPAAAMLFPLLILLHQQMWMPWVVGANDNASGVAVLLLLGQELQGLQYTDLWLVATGSKEAGLRGIAQFLRRYPFPRCDTYVFNVDSVGRGRLCVAIAEGLPWPRKADPLLSGLASQVQAADVDLNADPHTLPLMRSETRVALARGFRAISVTAIEGGRPANWHWPTDTPEHIQPELLERTARLVSGIAHGLDRLAAEKRTG